MSYQVTLNSRNVLVPISLENADGERMNGPLAKMETATAMMIQVSAEGGFQQEFFPLIIRQESNDPFAGKNWELWVQKTGVGFYAYYLGIPDAFFAVESSGESASSLSVQVVGTSPLTGREDFSGGVDISLQAQVKPPLIPGFLNLSERFFPTLLPQNFIESASLDVFEFEGKRQLVLKVAPQMDSSDRLPISLEKHWEPKSWIEAVVENLGSSGYFTIRGGCFFSRNRKVSHWFGGTIGLEAKWFRQSTTEKIRAMKGSGKGAWIFWLDPQGMGEFEPESLVAAFPDTEKIKVSIRHPMMHRLLSYGGLLASVHVAPSHLGGLSAQEAVSALAHVAKILSLHRNTLYLARSEPTHAIWSELTNTNLSPVDAFVENSSGRIVERRMTPRAGLDFDIRLLYQSFGESLRALESLFDETFGYSAWDTIGNPLRDTLISFLSETGNERQASLDLGIQE